MFSRRDYYGLLDVAQLLEHDLQTLDSRFRIDVDLADHDRGFVEVRRTDWVLKFEIEVDDNLGAAGLALAAQVLDSDLFETEEFWPECKEPPQVRHLLQLRNVNGEAIWSCSLDQRPLILLGELVAPPARTD